MIFCLELPNEYVPQGSIKFPETSWIFENSSTLGYENIFLNQLMHRISVQTRIKQILNEQLKIPLEKKNHKTLFIIIDNLKSCENFRSSMEVFVVCFFSEKNVPENRLITGSLSGRNKTFVIFLMSFGILVSRCFRYSF